MSTELREKLHETAARPSSSVDLDAIGAGIRRRRGRRVGAIAGGVAAGVVVAAFVAGGLQSTGAPEIQDPIGTAPETESPSAPSTEAGSMTASQLQDELERVTAEMDDLLRRMETLRAREADLERQQSEGADVSEELDAVSTELVTLETAFADLANQQFALQVQLMELGELEDPYVGARLAVTDDDRQLVEHLTNFARDSVTFTLNRDLFADQVSIGVGTDMQETGERQQVDVLLSGYHEPASVSALELLAQDRPRQILVGEHPHCAGAPKPAPAGFEDHRRVSVQPLDTTTCLQWWTVDLFVNDAGLVEAVTIDQWEF